MSAKLTTKSEKLDSSSSVEYTIESDSSDYFNHGRKLPPKTTEWKMSHLLELGIHFDKSSTDLDTLMSSVKQIFRKPKQSETDSEISKMHKCLIELTKDWWTFSFDLESAEKSLTGEGVVETLTLAEKAINVFEQENYNIMENLNKTNLGDWRRYLVNKLFCLTSLNFY